MNNADIYDDTLTKQTPLNLSEAKDSVLAATVGNYALILGGSLGGSSYSNIVEIYDVSEEGGKFNAVSNLEQNE